MMRNILSLVLLLMAGCTVVRPPIAAPTETSAVDWSQARRVDVMLDDFAFTPDRLTLSTGHPYRLHLENRGSGGHNFDASAFFRTVAFRDGPAADRVRASGGVAELAGGEIMDVDVVPKTSGSYPLECSHPFHSTFGMTGEIVVR
jgi:uncharacterized cupredoxin-like copper-binding protein